VSDFVLTARTGLERILTPGVYGAAAAEPGLAIALRPDVALAMVMARKGKQPELEERVHSTFGLSLPATPRRVDNGVLSFIWAGPGRWLVATSAHESQTLERILRGELTNAASIVNQSDGRSVVRVRGAQARECLERNLPIDIDPRVFGPGHVALTLAGHINVHVWQLDATPTYEFAVPRSFTASFCRWLFAAGARYGYRIESA